MPTPSLGPERVYRFTIDLAAPIEFVFRWATDYRANDASRSHQGFERRVLERDQSRVVFEDLERQPGGWVWRRSAVVLRPPDRWHSHSQGSHRFAEVDYRLARLGPERTRLTITMHRRATAAHPKHPTAAAFEADLRHAWTGYGRALARDYRAARGRRRRSR